MVRNGYKRKYLPDKKTIERDSIDKKDLDYAFIISNERLIHITNTWKISEYCEMQHLKYIAHITRLPNNTYQKQFLFSLERKKFSRNKWLKIEKQLGISTMQIQKLMQNKEKFMFLMQRCFTNKT